MEERVGRRIRVAEESAIRLTVNEEQYELRIGHRPDEVAPSHTLAHTLRETLGLTGTKIGCDHGACGLAPFLWTARQSYRA